MAAKRTSAPAPDAAELAALARELIAEQSTMTLATAQDDEPWAAPVYYVFSAPGFYFFSDPASRHISQALAGGRAAAAIFAQAEGWQQIRGLQMAGAIKALATGPRAAAVIRLYMKRFRFVKELLGQGASWDLAAFKARFKVALYGFYPELVYYLDNRIKFGFRQAIDL